jgi:hypothetical protein
MELTINFFIRELILTKQLDALEWDPWNSKEKGLHKIHT